MLSLRRKDSVLLMTPGGGSERTLTGALDDFVLFGRVIWVAAVLPSARHSTAPSDRPPGAAPD